MLPEKYRWIAVEFEPEGNAWPLFEIASEAEAEGDLTSAATVYDRAFGLAPEADEIGQARMRVLDQLAVVEHGICFRYIPEGVFLMGSPIGESDEQPWHPVWLSAYWMSETPISWATYCHLMDWLPPPEGCPREWGRGSQEFDRTRFHLMEANKIRLQYCEDQTTRAQDWHSHAVGQTRQSGGQTHTAQALFGTPEREDPEAAWAYNTKPMVAVAWREAEELCEHLSISQVRYALPTEAQWEKAARGGRIGTRYAWGNEPPSHDRCDFERFAGFSISPMTTFPPNSYGLYAVNGGVWEWTQDWYDRDYYRHSPSADPQGPDSGQEKVLRGGSWADCADVVTVSFRMSRPSSSWRSGSWGGHLSPTIGFRLCRTVREVSGRVPNGNG